MKLWLVYYEGYSDSDGAIFVDSIWESAEAAGHRVDEDVGRVRDGITLESTIAKFKPHLPIGSAARDHYYTRALAEAQSPLRIKEIETATRLDMDL